MIGIREMNLDQLAVDYRIDVKPLPGAAQLSVLIRINSWTSPSILLSRLATAVARTIRPLAWVGSCPGCQVSESIRQENYQPTTGRTIGTPMVAATAGADAARRSPVSGRR